MHLPFSPQFGHAVQQGPRHQHVEPGRGLVEDQHRRVVDDGPGDRHLLPHAGRHLRPQHVADVVHLELLEERFHALGQFGGRQAVEAAEILDHLPGGHAVVNGRIGRHEADLAADLRRLQDHVVAVDAGRAVGGPQHGAEDPQGGGLSRSVGAQKTVDLAGQRMKTQPIQRDESAAAEVGVMLGQSLDFDHPSILPRLAAATDLRTAEFIPLPCHFQALQVISALRCGKYGLTQLHDLGHAQGSTDCGVLPRRGTLPRARTAARQTAMAIPLVISPYLPPVPPAARGLAQAVLYAARGHS